VESEDFPEGVKPTFYTFRVKKGLKGWFDPFLTARLPVRSFPEFFVPLLVDPLLDDEARGKKITSLIAGSGD
jgi:hypothetical protein